MTDFIKEFWDNQAKTFGTSSDASWRDNFALQLEIDTISKYIKQGNTVLDAGCANGYSAYQQLKNKNIKIVGTDFSEFMIQEANKANEYNKKCDDIKFQVADIKQLPFDTNTFDVTYTTRVLINLPNWGDQVKGIEECIRVTKKGGIIIISEAFYEPLMLLNSLRQLKNLKPLVEHDFNRYIKKYKLEHHLQKMGFIDGNDEYMYECIDFSSVYYLGSRFLRELITNVDEYPGYSNPINKVFYELEKQFSGGGFGIQQAYIIRK